MGQCLKLRHLARCVSEWVTDWDRPTAIRKPSHASFGLLSILWDPATWPNRGGLRTFKRRRIWEIHRSVQIWSDGGNIWPTIGDAMPLWAKQKMLELLKVSFLWISRLLSHRLLSLSRNSFIQSFVKGGNIVRVKLVQGRRNEIKSKTRFFFSSRTLLCGN